MNEKPLRNSPGNEQGFLKQMVLGACRHEGSLASLIVQRDLICSK